MLEHAHFCSVMLEDAHPCSSMLAHARGVAVNATIYIEDERETWRTRRIKIYIYIYIYIYIIYIYNLYVRYFINEYYNILSC